MKKVVVLLSGGIDSTTSMAMAKAEGFDVYALSFDYGQRHRRELESAKRVASILGAKKHLVIRFDLREIGGSALTSDIEVPKDREALSVKREKIETRDERQETSNNKNSSLVTRRSSLIPITYVPARNTIFLSFALAWAEVLDAEEIVMGANSVDYSGYPDCRQEYIESFERLSNLATKAAVEGKRHFKIRSPLIKMTKVEIIKEGIKLGVDYSLTWSCYDPQPKQVQSSNPLSPPFTKGEQGGINNSRLPILAPLSGEGLSPTLNQVQGELIPCGTCDSCYFREKGFREAGIEDPLYKS